jgi:hypothetical protein
MCKRRLLASFPRAKPKDALLRLIEMKTRSKNTKLPFLRTNKSSALTYSNQASNHPAVGKCGPILDKFDVDMNNLY